MKLSQVNYNTTLPAQVEITDHLGKSFEPKAFISVIAFDSKEGKKVQLDMYRDILKIREDKANLNEDETIKDEVIQRSSAKALAQLTTGWEGIEDEKGKPIKFSVEKCEEVYLSVPYIFDKVNTFCGNLGNYLAQ